MADDVTWPGQTRDPNTLKAQSRKQLEMLVSNYLIVCCEALVGVGLAIATAWLSVSGCLFIYTMTNKMTRPN